MLKKLLLVGALFLVVSNQALAVANYDYIVTGSRCRECNDPIKNKYETRLFFYLNNGTQVDSYYYAHPCGTC
jgi:hypothetical protein